MQEYENGSFCLELIEIIKINQLVRNQINYDDFKIWYMQLSISEQHVLTSTILQFAYQAGVDNQVWEDVFNLGKGLIKNEMVESIKSFHRDDLGLHNWAGFHKWQLGLSENDRDGLFAIAVYLFGTAEGRVYRKEQQEWCNHWWHRDLLDSRVVEALLTDHRFYMTAMKDDEEIKRGYT
jgi:hypothetical protein